MDQWAESGKTLVNLNMTATEQIKQIEPLKGGISFVLLSLISLIVLVLAIGICLYMKYRTRNSLKEML